MFHRHFCHAQHISLSVLFVSICMCWTEEHFSVSGLWTEEQFSVSGLWVGDFPIVLCRSLMLWITLAVWCADQSGEDRPGVLGPVYSPVLLLHGRLLLLFLPHTHTHPVWAVRTGLRNCGSGEGKGTITCLKTVVVGKHGHAACKMFLPQQSLFLCQSNVMEITRTRPIWPPSVLGILPGLCLSIHVMLTSICM